MKKSRDRRYWEWRLAQGTTSVSRDADQYREEEIMMHEWARCIPVEQGRLLDFGCGHGRFLGPLATQRHQLLYYGHDLTHPRTYASEWFDCVVAFFVLQHITREWEYREAINLIYNYLKPSGFFLVVDTIRSRRWPWARHMQPRGPDGVIDRFRHPIKIFPDWRGHWVHLYQRRG